VPAETPPVPSAEDEAMPATSPVLESLTFAKVTSDAIGTVITVPAALIFNAGKDGLSKESKARLDEIATGLKERREKISVEVHTDSTGSHVANQQLSAKRARAVKDYLISKGIEAGRVEAHGLGDTRPLVENDSAKNRATNRRLEIVLKPVPVS
jgi:outer membrane protein OmpA-like peptidoglycan-associated protein